jgi:hypothetical protein
MGGVAGTAGAGGGDASTGDARDSASTSDVRDGATTETGSDSTSGSDVTSPTDGSAVDGSTVADTGAADANVCPASSPTDNTACSVTVAGGCVYGQQRCFCTAFGLPADAGRRWNCIGTAPTDASTTDAGAGCPATKPEGGLACSPTGQFCNFGGGGLNFCFCDNNQQWFCF